MPLLPAFFQIGAKGNTFSISSPFDVTKLQKFALTFHRLVDFRSQCQWTHIRIPYLPYGDGDSAWTSTALTESLFISLFPKTMVLTLLSVITIHITETKIHISYSENHDATLMLVFYYFYVSTLPTHAHIIAKGAFKRHRKYHHSSQRPEKL